MNTRRKPVKGETLWALPINNQSRRDSSGLRAVVVTSVGPKYFVAAGTKYRVDTWSEVTNTCSSFKLYETEQDRLNEKEAQDICDLLYQALNYDNRRKLSLVTLRTMRAALLANVVVK